MLYSLVMFCYVNVTLFSCGTFFILHSFHVALFSYYNHFMLCYFFHFSYFLCAALFYVVLFSRCTLFMLYFFCGALLPCCTFAMLEFFHVAHFPCFSISKLHFFRVVQFSRCTFFFHSFHVALFLCCSFPVFHCFNVAMSWVNFFRTGLKTLEQLPVFLVERVKGNIKQYRSNLRKRPNLLNYTFNSFFSMDDFGNSLSK